MSASSYKLELYISDQCIACDIVEAFIEENDIDCRVLKLETGVKNRGKISILVFPALVDNGNLIAYGEDIITYLKKNYLIEVGASE